MVKQTAKFPDNTRVKLRDGIHPSFYNDFGYPGNEGIIRKHKEEDHGYQRVYIEWDKDHWAFNGAPDIWTFEDHFELVNQLEDNMTENNKEKSEKLASVLVGAIEDFLTEDNKDLPEDVVSLNNEQPSKDNFEDTLQKSFEAASDSDAFFVVTVNREQVETDGVMKEIAVPNTFHDSKNIEASLLGHLIISQLSTDFVTQLVSEKIRAEKET